MYAAPMELSWEACAPSHLRAAHTATQTYRRMKFDAIASVLARFGLLARRRRKMDGDFFMVGMLYIMQAVGTSPIRVAVETGSAIMDTSLGLRGLDEWATTSPWRGAGSSWVVTIVSWVGHFCVVKGTE